MLESLNKTHDGDMKTPTARESLPQEMNCTVLYIVQIEGRVLPEAVTSGDLT